MRRWLNMGAIVLGLAALASPAPAAESLRPVRLASLEGMPPDMRSREAFLDGFRAAFEQPTLPTLIDGAAGVFEHGFALVDSSSARTWELHIVVGAPPLLRDVVRDKKGKLVSQKPNGRRASRGLTLVLTALSPVAIESGERPGPERIGLVLPEAEGFAAQRAVTRGVEYRWDQAGLASGRVAIEALLRVAGDAPATAWTADVQPARRVVSTR